MEERVIEKTEESITKILDEGLNTTNLDHLLKLSKIKHYAKEDKEMNYGNYGGRRAGYDSYGRDEYGRGNYGEYSRDSYGARGYDRRYRGHDSLDRMYEDYGRYMGDRERYGAGSEDSKKSLKYMLESMEDFARMLKEDATSQEEVMMIKQAAQRIANM